MHQCFSTWLAVPQDHRCAILPAGKDLSFVFTNVDPQDHARQFAFGVTVQEGQTYAGMACLLYSQSCLFCLVYHLTVAKPPFVMQYSDHM